MVNLRVCTCPFVIDNTMTETRVSVVAVHGGLPGCYGTAMGPLSFHTGTTVHVDACLHKTVAFVLVPVPTKKGRLWVDLHIPLRAPLPSDPGKCAQAVQQSLKDPLDVQPYYDLRECLCNQGCDVFTCTSDRCQSRLAASTPADEQEYPCGLLLDRLQRLDTEQSLASVRTAREHVQNVLDRQPAQLTSEMLRNALFGPADSEVEPAAAQVKRFKPRTQYGFLQARLSTWPEHIIPLVRRAQEAFLASQAGKDGLEALCRDESDFFKVDADSGDIADTMGRHWAEGTCGPPPATAGKVSGTATSVYGYMVRAPYLSPTLPVVRAACAGGL